MPNVLAKRRRPKITTRPVRIAIVTRGIWVIIVDSLPLLENVDLPSAIRASRVPRLAAASVVDATSFGKSCTGHKEGAAGGSRDEAENKGQEVEGQDQKVMRSDVHSEGLRTSVVENWSIIYRSARFAWTGKNAPKSTHIYIPFTPENMFTAVVTHPHMHTLVPTGTEGLAHWTK